MLKSYSVKNFKSFRDTIHFDTVADEQYDYLQDNKQGNLLKCLLFVGPNASGKTNSINILLCLLQIISHDDFNLNYYKNIYNDGDVAISFTFEFTKNLVDYSISYNSETKQHTDKLTVNDTIIFDKTQSSPYIKVFYEDMLYLDNPILVKWFNYLDNSVVLDVTATTNNLKIGNINPKIDFTEEVISVLNNFFITHDFDFTIQASSTPCPIGNIKILRTGTDIPIPYEYESFGVKNIIYTLPIVYTLTQNEGMLLLDEYGSGLHNELKELVLKYFMHNSKHSQIFIVSHSTNLLKTSLLRPDQIYAIENCNNRGSIPEKFSVQLPRKNQNLEKMYLGGVFGALPNFNKK